MADIKYDIVEEVREAKYDLRDWAPDHAKMGKGITLSIDELRQLKNLLNNMDI